MLENCFGFALKNSVSGNLNFGKLWAVFPSHINCIGKKLPERVIPKVSVLACFYVNLAPYTCLEFFAAIVRLETGAYFWSIFITSEARIEYFLTLLTISWWNINSASLRAPSGISGRAVVQALFTKPIFTKKIFANDKFLKSKTLSDLTELFTISAFTTVITTMAFTRPPFERKVSKVSSRFCSKNLELMVQLCSEK